LSPEITTVTFGIRRRLTLAILLTALIPVLVAIWLAETTVRQTSARFFVPEVGASLDRSLGLYQELARAVKAAMKSEAAAMAADDGLGAAVAAGDDAQVKRALTRLFRGHPDLVSLLVRNGERTLAEVNRGRPDAGRAHDEVEAPPVGDDEALEGPELVAVFAAQKARFEELSDASQFVETYKRIERRRSADERSYVLAFSALLGITILAAVGVGSLVARGPAQRVVALEAATRRVALGDLSVRVPEVGDDELGKLARAFNRMLSEVEASRSRIEYLQRISAWQEMARRLAHEIKNPLTPIQLAVQDIHRRYDGQSKEFRKLLDTTLEVVEDEVGTLRRLVSEFSDFARLPQAELEQADLAEFISDLAGRPLFMEEELAKDGAEPPTIRFEIEPGPALVLIDRQMLRRVLINLVRNAAQAMQGKGHIMVRLHRDGDAFHLDVDDDGPGIPVEIRDQIFDPYVTTKTDGTGLGLSIVKKIVIEHRGSIVALDSPLGGARLRVRLPALN
jgi:two-component system nitrogen regulation sensor histidine kinase NtrY